MALSDNLKRGTIELLLLTLLSEEDKYGYQLSNELETKSGGRYTLKESSLYPPLYRMVEKGFITSRDHLVKGRNRVYYHMEPAGKEHLARIRKKYLSLTSGSFQILGIQSLEELNHEK